MCNSGADFNSSHHLLFGGGKEKAQHGWALLIVDLTSLGFAAIGGQVLLALHQILGRDPVALSLGLVGLNVLSLVAAFSHLVDAARDKLTKFAR